MSKNLNFNLVGVFTTVDPKLIEAPLAMDGLQSYRCKVDNFYVMVGATSRQDAMDKIFEYWSHYNSGNLETYSGTAYTPVFPAQFRDLQPEQYRKLAVRRPRQRGWL